MLWRFAVPGPPIGTSARCCPFAPRLSSSAAGDQRKSASARSYAPPSLNSNLPKSNVKHGSSSTVARPLRVRLTGWPALPVQYLNFVESRFTRRLAAGSAAVQHGFTITVAVSQKRLLSLAPWRRDASLNRSAWRSSAAGISSKMASLLSQPSVSPAT